MAFYIGTSGYMYKHWNNDVFYPRGVKDRMSFYAEQFNTVEINSSFYSIPTPETVRKWNEKAPDDFKLVLKSPRSVTHNRMLRLRNFDNPDMRQGIDLLDYFIQSHKEVQYDHRGPTLVQIPQKLSINLDRLNRVLLVFQAYGLRVAFEARDPSWCDDSVFRLLKKYGASLVVSDWPSFKTPLVTTSNFIYVRRHGVNGSYAGEYTEAQLQKDVEKFYPYSKHNDIYVYFNNDGGGAAPRNARRMQEIVNSF